MLVGQFFKLWKESEGDNSEDPRTIVSLTINHILSNPFTPDKPALVTVMLKWLSRIQWDRNRNLIVWFLILETNL